MKLLVVSAWAPPMGGGSPIALAQRLGALPRGSYSILTSERRAFETGSGTEWLAAKYHFLGEETAEPSQHPQAEPAARSWTSSLHRLPRPLQPLLRIARDVYEVSFRSRAVDREAIRIIREERPDAVLATSDDGVFLVAAYRAARATDSRLFVLLLDVYAGNNYSIVKRVLARVFERRILRYAKTVFVTNARAQEHYRILYGIDSIVAEHPSPPTATTPAKRAGREPVLLYTGSIYWAQSEAMRDLIDALALLPHVRLRLLTEQSKEDLRRLGLDGPQVEIARCSVSEVRTSQARADVLFLPLGFTKRGMDVIRTAAPGKMAEYLVSGVPILVHAPADSYVSRDARALGWGSVVDGRDAQSLADTIKTLLTDDALRQRLVANAFRIAAARHNEATGSELFRRELGAAVSTET